MTEKRKVDGILLLHKSISVSSNAALQQVKRLFKAQKAGHTGSLDPLATGVLPICLGEATKFSGYLLDADKTYTAWGRLGYTSPTGDAEGNLTPIFSAPLISEEQFRANLNNFKGQIKQIPPAYSALKKDGVPLYKLARKGRLVDTKIMEEKARQVTIYDIQLKQYAYPDFEITVTCSKGTYIRTLAEDIGRSLNSGAYLLNLRRDKAGPYSLEKSFTIQELEKGLDTLDSLLLPIDTAVLDFPKILLNAEQVKALQQGKVISVDSLNSDTLIRLYTSDNMFIGLGQLSSSGEIRVQRLVAF